MDKTRSCGSVFSSHEEHELCVLSPEHIRVLKVDPGAAPEIMTMPNVLDAFQEAVGGDIEVLGLDANAMLVCNGLGKLIGLPANRQVECDTIAGTFLVVGAEDGEFCSLTDADAAHDVPDFLFFDNFRVNSTAQLLSAYVRKVNRGQGPHFIFPTVSIFAAKTGISLKCFDTKLPRCCSPPLLKF